MGITPYLAKERVENEVCPNTEYKKINSGTTDTENTRTKGNGTTNDTEQAQYYRRYKQERTWRQEAVETVVGTVRTVGTDEFQEKIFIE